jgi:hypothetical protein
MPEQDPSTGEVQHSDEVVDVTFPAGDQPPIVVQPGEETFSLPAATGAPKAAAVLRRLVTTAPMGGDHLDRREPAQPASPPVRSASQVALNSSGVRYPRLECGDLISSYG